jgi:hypothetical protein
MTFLIVVKVSYLKFLCGISFKGYHFQVYLPLKVTQTFLGKFCHAEKATSLQYPNQVTLIYDTPTANYSL